MPVDEPMPITPVAGDAADVPVTPASESIWIMPSPGTAESFQTTVIDPDTHRAVPFTVERETLRYRFFATAGTFAPAATSSERNPAFDVKAPIRIESQYTLPTADQIATDADGQAVVTIWVVVRDDRGGESWQHASSGSRRSRLARTATVAHRACGAERLARRRCWRHARGHVELSEGEVARPR